MRRLVDLNTNDSNFAISVWRFSPHWVVQFTIVSIGQTGASCHEGQVVTMALLRKVFTRAQYRSHTRSVRKCPLFLRPVLCDGMSYDQRTSFTLSSTPSQILLSQFSIFFNAINCYIFLKCVILPNTSANQQHKYLKYGGRESVASKKMTLGQVVPNFTGQIVSSKIVRIFR